MDAARDLLDLVLAPLRGRGVVRRYRVSDLKDGVRGMAVLVGRGGNVGELRVQVDVEGADATVVIRWKGILGGRWWAEVVEVSGGGADPYRADLGAVGAVTDDVRRWAGGSLGGKALNGRYTRVPGRAATDAAWARGMGWA